MTVRRSVALAVLGPAVGALIAAGAVLEPGSAAHLEVDSGALQVITVDELPTPEPPDASDVPGGPPDPLPRPTEPPEESQPESPPGSTPPDTTPPEPKKSTTTPPSTSSSSTAPPSTPPSTTPASSAPSSAEQQEPETDQ